MNEIGTISQPIARNSEVLIRSESFSEYGSYSRFSVRSERHVLFLLLIWNLGSHPAAPERGNFILTAAISRHTYFCSWSDY